MAILERLREIVRGRSGRATTGPVPEPSSERAIDAAQPFDIETSEGSLRLLPIPEELFARIQSSLTLGAIRLPRSVEGAAFALVMKCGAAETLAVKWQPPDCEAAVGERVANLHRVMIAHALPAYARAGFAGLLLPAPYLKAKPGGLAEAGIAYFGNGVETGPQPGAFRHYDDRLGPGFGSMMSAFAEAKRESARELRLPVQTVIGVELRPRSQLGIAAFEFMAHGRDLICVKFGISERDPVWSMFLRRGVRELFYMPSIQLDIEEAQLPLAKGAAGAAHS